MSNMYVDAIDFPPLATFAFVYHRRPFRSALMTQLARSICKTVAPATRQCDCSGTPSHWNSQLLLALRRTSEQGTAQGQLVETDDFGDC